MIIPVRNAKVIAISTLRESQSSIMSVILSGMVAVVLVSLFISVWQSLRPMLSRVLSIALPIISSTTAKVPKLERGGEGGSEMEGGKREREGEREW